MIKFEIDMNIDAYNFMVNLSELTIINDPLQRTTVN